MRINILVTTEARWGAQFFSVQNRESDQSRSHLIYVQSVFSFDNLESRLSVISSPGEARRRGRRNLCGPVRSLFRILLLWEWPEKDGVGNCASLSPFHPLARYIRILPKRFDRQLADRRRNEQTDERRLISYCGPLLFFLRFCPYAAHSFRLDRVVVRPFVR